MRKQFVLTVAMLALLAVRALAAEPDVLIADFEADDYGDSGVTPRRRMRLPMSWTSWRTREWNARSGRSPQRPRQCPAPGEGQ